MKASGRVWRVQSDSQGWFDEVVVKLAGRGGPRGADEVIHLERMDLNTFFVDLAGCVFTVWRDTKGRVHVRHFEDRDGQVLLGPNDDPTRRRKGKG